jgi:hypothetical protein
VAARFGISKRGLEKWLQTRRRLGYVIPGVTALGKHTDESLEWIREQRAPLTSAAGRPIRGRQSQPTTDDIDDFLDGGNPQDDQDAKPRVTKPAQSAHVPAVVTGLTAASRVPNHAEIWERSIATENHNRSKADKRHDQWVIIPDDKPILLALLTDPHLGNAHCSYSLAKSHAEWVRDTDGVYGGMLGDVIDNWVSLDPRILGIQREQPMQHADELALLESWIGMMRDKLVVAVSGNHDLRTYRLAGVDLVQRALGNAAVLYDQYEVKFTLRLGEAEWRFKVRHQWPGRSQLIDTYAIQKDAKFNDGSWTIGVGGHTHGSSVFAHFRDKPHDNLLKLAVILGSYEYDSSYARELNLPRSEPGGCGAIMFWPNGSYQYWYDLEAATRFLAMERAR